MPSLKINIVGLPGSGKTTQAVRLSKALGVPYISIGEKVAALVKTDSPLADAISVHLNSPIWQPLPDDLALAVVEQSTAGLEAWIVEGFPRNQAQAEGFKENIDLIVYLNIPEEVSIQRMAQRERKDDSEQTTKQRIAVERRRFTELVNYCRTQFQIVEVDGTLQEVAVTEAILNQLQGGAA